MPQSLENLPDGITLQLLDEYARTKENERRRAYYRKNPERMEAQRMTTYTNFLTRRGKLVMSMPPAPPWNELQEKAILSSIKAAMEVADRG